MSNTLVPQLKAATQVLSNFLHATSLLKEVNEQERAEVIDDLSGVIKEIAIELGSLMGTSAKQTLSTVMEYELSKYVNNAYGYQVLQPNPGTRGADATWIVDPAGPQTVEQKATEVERAKPNKKGREFLSATVSIYDWDLQLLRDRFNWGLHNDNLEYEAALMISKPGVDAMFSAATTKYGAPAATKAAGQRTKASFTIKELVSFCPVDSVSFIVGGQLVPREKFITLFFGAGSPLLKEAA